MKLDTKEIMLSGGWTLVGTTVEADSVAKRIEKLILEYLIYIKSDFSGWSKLYQDPIDKRYWELIYPDSELQGVGAPTLQNISKEEAILKYQL